jgi:hypothetical protein
MRMSRRTVVKAGLAVGIGALVPSATTANASITHPGMLHTQADLTRMRDRVRAGAEPWLSGWRKLVANPHSASTWRPKPQRTIVRGGHGPQNYSVLYHDVHAAYQNALRYRITGEQAHGDCARNVLNAWSGTLTTITGSSDRFLAAGIYGYQFANAAELLRGYPGFDLDRFAAMMRTVFHPLNDDFLTHHNGACTSHYWANWDLCSMNSVLATGILCDDQAVITRVVDYFRTGAGNGSLEHATPFVYQREGFAQWQESGRDQGHSTMGIGLLGSFCEMAWNQGYDLYGHDDNRFLKACEYVASYNLGNDVPFTTYRWGSGKNCDPQQQTRISAAGRGDVRPIWALVHNHYARRRGLPDRFTEQCANQVQPEGGGGDYGPNSGGFDQLGFGTLTFTR